MVIVEIIVTSAIVITAAGLLYRSVKKKANGECDCGSCSTHCPKHKKE